MYPCRLLELDYWNYMIILLYLSVLIFQIFQWRGKEASTSRYGHDDAAVVVGLVFNMQTFTWSLSWLL